MPGLPKIRTAAIGSTGVLALLLGAVVAIPAEAGAAPNGRAAVAAQDCRAVVSFDRHEFPRHPKINNRFLPLRPGTNTVLSGTVRDDNGHLHSHQILSTASDVTKVLDGIRTVVVFERDIQDGTLQESELAFLAQDEQGTVWNIGEYPEEYEDGKLVGADTWISGVARAKAGVAMRAHPKVGTAAYLQGVAPAVDFRDCAQVARKGERRCEAGHCYKHVLAVDEFSPLDPSGGHQLKYYAPKIGNIEVGAVGGSNPEVLHLASHSTLGRAALARVNRQVLAEDLRGYRVSPDAYGHTPRAELARCHDH